MWREYWALWTESNLSADSKQIKWFFLLPFNSDYHQLSSCGFYNGEENKSPMKNSKNHKTYHLNSLKNFFKSPLFQQFLSTVPFSLSSIVLEHLITDVLVQVEIMIRMFQWCSLITASMRCAKFISGNHGDDTNIKVITFAYFIQKNEQKRRWQHLKTATFSQRIPYKTFSIRDDVFLFFFLILLIIIVQWMHFFLRTCNCQKVESGKLCRLDWLVVVTTTNDKSFDELVPCTLAWISIKKLKG